MNDDEVAQKGKTLVGNAEVAAVKLNCMIARTSESSRTKMFIFQELAAKKFPRGLHLGLGPWPKKFSK